MVISARAGSLTKDEIRPVAILRVQAQLGVRIGETPNPTWAEVPPIRRLVSLREGFFPHRYLLLEHALDQTIDGAISFILNALRAQEVVNCLDSRQVGWHAVYFMDSQPEIG